MPEAQRLTKSGQYAHVYQKGSSWASALLVLKAVPNELMFSRWGLSVSRRVGGAVVRNRVKRVLREILRQTPVKAGWDIIILVRPAAAQAKYVTLEKALRALFARSQLLSE